MDKEKSLINKSYYHLLLEGKEEDYPIMALGNMFMEEQQKEVTDLSEIRFAQGEVYYLNHDFEAAIFKWESITNEFKPWAQKNIADAHVELDLLEIAEEFYYAVDTESINLQTEVYMQLFSLYIQRNRLDKAKEVLKQAVDLNPGYPGVTDTARAFYEEHAEYHSAVMLAVDESIRTENLSWFDELESYVEHGLTTDMEPKIFNKVLVSLYALNQPRFERLVVAFGRSYKHTEYYFAWLYELNQLMGQVSHERTHIWSKLSPYYKETYLELIKGDYFINDLSHLLPSHLSNWMKVSTETDTLFSSAAVLAWNETFPSTMEVDTVKEAERRILDVNEVQHDPKSVYELFETLIAWAKNKGLSLGERYEWMVQQLLNDKTFHLMMVSADATNKEHVVNTLLDKKISGDWNTTTFYQHHEEYEIHAIQDEERWLVENLNDLKEQADFDSLVCHVKLPAPFLDENKLTIIDTPTISTEQRKARKTVFENVEFADSVLLVLNADVPLTYKELELAIRIREQAPELPIHFVLSNYHSVNMDATELLNKTSNWIHTYFPKAETMLILPNAQSTALTSFVNSLVQGYPMKEERNRKLLYYTKEAIKLLLTKRTIIENSLKEKIQWDEEVITKLEGAVNQLNDIQEEKVDLIKRSYSSGKEDMRDVLLIKIPEILRQCSEIVKEDTDLTDIHLKINKEMNKRISDYMELTALPNYRNQVQQWVSESEELLKDIQVILDEMAVSFNGLLEEDKLSLQGDFNILNDWQRDIERMTSGSLQLDENNFVLGSNASQMLLKGAGKLFSSIPQNKGMVQNRYKQYLENKDYTKITESITNTYIQQFEFFERTLERDVHMFFTRPFGELERTISEKEAIVVENKATLENMQENPEVYRDPLKLFQLKVCQYQWMSKDHKKAVEV
ncbi:GTP-binding protein [Oceanobacillus piezotolerans]|uniref:GTP-binding protein n=1 Tax=Oceanobacillus piezotolerans TaxID=2448030 RepID=A0A498D5B5_9BACI|nr:GTP-binding protein [Oceanobacillus piezotolerans]RLL44869.1 GTP-binding protein [Oceanobacillus piezotolerans]